MHPYDYLSNQEFWVPYKDFARTSKIKNIIMYFRQNQWSNLGNSNVFSKVRLLAKFFTHQGTMSSAITEIATR